MLRWNLMLCTAVVAVCATVVRDLSAADLAAVICSISNGDCSDPATWEGGKVPGAGDRVLIRNGQDVTY